MVRLRGVLALGLIWALPVWPAAGQTVPFQEGTARPYPFGVWRLDSLNNEGRDSRGWNFVLPKTQYPGPAQSNSIRKRYGLPPLGATTETPSAPASNTNKQ